MNGRPVRSPAWSIRGAQGTSARRAAEPSAGRTPARRRRRRPAAGARAAIGGTNRITVPASPQSIVPPAANSVGGVTASRPAFLVDLDPERAQGVPHQLGVARLQTVGDRRGPAGQGGQHQGPVRLRLRTRHVHGGPDRIVGDRAPASAPTVRGSGAEVLDTAASLRELDAEAGSKGYARGSDAGATLSRRALTVLCSAFFSVFLRDLVAALPASFWACSGGVLLACGGVLLGLLRAAWPPRILTACGRLASCFAACFLALRLVATTAPASAAPPASAPSTRSWTLVGDLLAGLLGVPGQRLAALRGAVADRRPALGVPGGEQDAAEQAHVLEEVGAVRGRAPRRSRGSRTGAWRCVAGTSVAARTRAPSRRPLPVASASPPTQLQDPVDADQRDRILGNGVC